MRFWFSLIAMLALANISDGLAQETNSPAPVTVTNVPVAVVSPPVKPPLRFEVTAYDVQGNAVLPPEKISGVLSNYTGRLDFARLHEGLRKLQYVYRQSGFSNISVTLPRQELSNGIMRVKIITHAPIVQASAQAPATNAPVAAANFSAKPAPTFEVRAYRIEGNTVLPPKDFAVLTNYMGKTENVAHVREGLGKIQLRYRELGFSTISVALPRQKITNGVVTVKIVEGKLSGITVEGNRYFSSNNIARALPSLATNILINAKWFQPELDQANANRDRQIYPVIGPGPDPGTTELTLKVKDRLPLHGRMEINDKSSPGTPPLRVDTAAQYGNLWQHENQIGIDYNFSPEALKASEDHAEPYESPLVTSYSGFYRLPLGFGHGLREDYDQQPVTFGYDEISHKFNLPSPTGNPDLIFFASRSASDTPVQYHPNPPTLIISNSLAEVNSLFASHTFTVNNDIGAKFTLPVREFLGVKSSFLFGADYKSYSAQTFNTNLINFALYSLDPVSGNRTLVTNEVVSLAANFSQKLYYLPLSLGWIAARPDSSGSFLFNYNQNFFLQSFASARSGFQNVASSTKAGGNYTSLTAGLVRQQNLPGNWSATLNANGQWASEPLINIEQFGLGGTMGVRGYQEGEVYGDNGWRTLFDLHAPPVTVGYFPTATGEVPAELRCAWFMDYGQIYGPLLLNQKLSEWGTGASLYLTIGEHFDARLTAAWALLGTDASPAATANKVFVSTSAGDAQVYFSVGFQF